MLRIETLAGEAEKALEAAATGDPPDRALQTVGDEELRAALGSLLGDAPAIPVPAPGDRFGEFEIVSVLSREAQPLLVRAKDPYDDGIEERELALKQLPSGGPAARARAVLTQIRVHRAGSEAAAEVLGFHLEGKAAFLVRRYVPGVPLSEILEKLKEEEVPPDAPTWRLAAGARGGGANVIGAKIVCRIGQFTARALSDVYRQGAIHGALKPENLICDDTVRPTVVDFGVGRPAAPFEAPEVIRSKDRDQARNHLSDLYALGVILHQGLTRVPIFGEGDQATIEERTLKRRPDLPTKHNFKASKEMTAITMGLLEKDPARRFKDAEELYEDLERYHRNEPIRRKAPSLLRRLFG